MEAIEAAVERRRPPRFPVRRCAGPLGLGILLGLSLCGCAARKAASFDDFKSSSREIELLEGSPFSGQKRYILADDEFVLEIREPRDMGAGVYRFDVSRLEERTLEPAVAAAAWRRIERLGIPSWRKNYSPADLAPPGSDGMDWSVDVRVGDTRAESRGNSAYPELSNPGRTVPIDGGANALDALKAILEPLGR